MNEYWQEVARELIAARAQDGFHAANHDADLNRCRWIGRALALMEQMLLLAADSEPAHA
jgi:hypothetical protein